MVSGLPAFLLPRPHSVFKQTDDGLVKAHTLPMRLFANSIGDIGWETSQRDRFHKLLLCCSLAARCIITRAALDRDPEFRELVRSVPKPFRELKHWAGTCSVLTILETSKWRRFTFVRAKRPSLLPEIRSSVSSSGGAMSWRMASKTTLNCASYFFFNSALLIPKPVPIVQAVQSPDQVRGPFKSRHRPKVQ